MVMVCYNRPERKHTRHFDPRAVGRAWCCAREAGYTSAQIRAAVKATGCANDDTEGGECDPKQGALYALAGAVAMALLALIIPTLRRRAAKAAREAQRSNKEVLDEILEAEAKRAQDQVDMVVKGRAVLDELLGTARSMGERVEDAAMRSNPLTAGENLVDDILAALYK